MERPEVSRGHTGAAQCLRGSRGRTAFALVKGRQAQQAVKGFEWKDGEFVVDTTKTEPPELGGRGSCGQRTWLESHCSSSEWVWMGWDCVSWGENWEKIKSSVSVIVRSISYVSGTGFLTGWDYSWTRAGRSGSMSRNMMFELLSAWEIIQKYKM